MERPPASFFYPAASVCNTAASFSGNAASFCRSAVTAEAQKGAAMAQEDEAGLPCRNDALWHFSSHAKAQSNPLALCGFAPLRDPFFRWFLQGKPGMVTFATDPDADRFAADR
jgi:hypothetical protein